MTVKKDLTYKNIWKSFLLYLLILIVINAIAAMLPADFELPTKDYDSIRLWRDYQITHTDEILKIYIINYIVTIFLCILYILPRDKSKLAARFINLPFRIAGIGCIGWLVYIVGEFIYLLSKRNELYISIGTVLLCDSIYAICMAFFTFTLCYFLCELIHRQLVLPKYFPEGKISGIPVKRRASLIMKMRNFYFSVVICPLVYLFLEYMSLNKKYNIQPDKDVLVVLSVVVVLGFLLFVLTVLYLSGPLKKLKKGVMQIESGDYSHRIDFVESDDFGQLTDAFNDMSEAIQTKNAKLAVIQDSIIKGMALMVESRDVNTGGHINRTSDCVRVFVNKLRKHPDYEFMDAHFFDSLIKAAPMHDLGKIAVDDAVLRKPGKFTPEEYDMMKTHSAEGAKIVEQVIGEVEDKEFKQIAINVAHYHHEKWNGEGYPCGLKADEIPLEARIMALADVFDALVSKRCYKDSFTYDKAFTIIEESLGSHFDPFLGIQFLACRKDLEKLYDSYAYISLASQNFFSNKTESV